MSTLRRFNPYALPDATIDRLATGRQEVLEDIVRHAEANLRSRPVQHVQIVAPRGFGKSFLMRMVQSALRCKRENGWPVAVTLLPEEQRNVRRPHLFLEEIRRVLEGRPASDLRVRWSEAHPQWDTGVVALDAAVVKKVGPNGLLIVIVENFDHLLTTVFRESNDQMQLRGWLSREASRIMLLTTALRQVDTDYAKPLFQAFTQLRLPPWTEEDCLAFFDRVRAHATLETLSDGERARARAIAVFSGGSPRIATVLYEVLQTKDALTAAAVLDKLVDELSDYYRNRIDLLSPRAQDVLDTLLRLGEPRSQTEVAAAMGQSQSRVAEVFGELTSDQILSDHPAATSRATLYQATDRLMVHFYRTRYFDPERRVSALEAITDFLAGFFSTEELRSEAQRLHAAGHSHEANVFERLPRRELQSWVGGTLFSMDISRDITTPLLR